MSTVLLETSKGNITIRLDQENAPKTTANFLQYVEENFFAGTLFHRVIPGFMIQGGGMTSGMGRKDTHAPIENEADNGLKNRRGTISMARTSDPHSASSQFFINLKDNDFLDYRASTPDGWGYCVFGEVIEGMDVVDVIAGVETGRSGMHQDVPVEEVLITGASLS